MKYIKENDKITFPEDVRRAGITTEEKMEVNRVNEVVENKKKEIIEMIKNIEDVWILGTIHRFIIGMTKEGD